MQLRLQVPEQLSGKNQQQLEALAFEALVVRLYALGAGRDQHNPTDHTRRGWAPRPPSALVRQGLGSSHRTR